MSNPSCAICYNSFISCVPRVLPCGHSLCSGCLLSLTEDRCPFCKGSFGDVCKIPVNYSLQELVKAAAPSHDCRSCPYPPQKWCSSCHRAICSVAQEDNWHPNHPLLSFAEQAQALEEEISSKKKDIEKLLRKSPDFTDFSVAAEIEELFVATKQALAAKIATEQEARKALAQQREQILRTRLEALEDLSNRLVKFTPEVLREGHALISADLHLPPLPIDWNLWLVRIYYQATEKLSEKISKLSVSETNTKFTTSSISCTGSSITHCGGLTTRPEVEIVPVRSSAVVVNPPRALATPNSFEHKIVSMIRSGNLAELKSSLPNSHITNYVGTKTPLILAILYQQVEIIDWLLEKGTGVNWTDHNGNAPLHYVCDLENQELQYVIADKLLRAGADIYKRNSVCSFFEFVNSRSSNQKLNSLVCQHVQG